MESDTRKQVIKNTSLVAVESVAAAVSPYLLLAFNFSKSMYGVGLQLRHQKALEWVEMIRDNPSIFTERILQSESFQDGFVFALEQYIRERSEEKRIYYRNIFCNFAQVENRENFEIERFYLTLNILNSNAISTLSRVPLSSSEPYQLFDMLDGTRESTFTLLQAGVLALDTTTRVEDGNREIGKIGGIGVIHNNYLPKNPFLITTEYGKRFISYLSYE